MSDHAPPRRSAAEPGEELDGTDQSRSGAPSPPRGDLAPLVIEIAALIRRIDAVWNETPETLVMLADWSDTLEGQKADIEDMRRSLGLSPVAEGPLRRMFREAALDLALLGRMGRRLRQIALHGERLRAAQADAAAHAPDQARRTLLERHHARTERHLARLRERLHPGR